MAYVHHSRPLAEVSSRRSRRKATSYRPPMARPPMSNPAPARVDRAARKAPDGRDLGPTRATAPDGDGFGKPLGTVRDQDVRRVGTLGLWHPAPERVEARYGARSSTGSNRSRPDSGHRRHAAAAWTADRPASRRGRTTVEAEPGSGRAMARARRRLGRWNLRRDVRDEERVDDRPCSETSFSGGPRRRADVPARYGPYTTSGLEALAWGLRPTSPERGHGLA